jgi:hypothetical protein
LLAVADDEEKLLREMPTFLRTQIAVFLHRDLIQQVGASLSLSLLS